ncbi:MAG: MopE-related protein [Myxococcota bacterium]
MKRLIAGSLPSVVMLALLLAPRGAQADPTVETFAVSAPSPMPPLTDAGASYNLSIAYVFTGDDLINPRIMVDLPPGILPIDVGDNSPFTSSCTFVNNPSFDPYYDWYCSLDAARVTVGQGTSGTLVIRINPARFVFANGDQVTLTAVLTADNLPASVSAEATVTIPTAVQVFDYPSLTDMGTVESPVVLDGGQPTVGIATSLDRQPTNTKTGYIGRGAEARLDITSAYETYRLPGYSVWAGDVEPWSLTSHVVSTFPSLLGPAGVQAISDGVNGYRAVQYVGGGSPNVRLWRRCGQGVVASELSASLWGSLTPGDPTLTPLDLGAGSSFRPLDPSQDLDCGMGASALAYDQGAAVVGAGYYAGGSFGLPMGSVPLYDFFAAMRLDPQLTYHVFSTNTSYAVAGYNPPVDLYGCDFGSDPVDLQRFLDEKDQRCTFLARSSTDGSQSYSGYTHVIAYADEYFLDESYGRSVFRYFGLYADTTLGCGLGGTPLHHEVAFASRRAPGGAIESTPWSTLDRVVDDKAPFYTDGPYFYDHVAYGTNIISADRGQTFVLGNDFSNSVLGKNPSATYTLPPGITLVDVLWIDSAYYGEPSSCESPSLNVTSVVNPDGTTTVDVALRATPSGGDWLYVANCENTDCSPAGNGRFQLSLYVDPTYQWHDGDVAQFDGRWDTTNSPYEGGYPTSGHITINVPNQQRLLLEPVCEGAGTPGDCGADTVTPRRPGLLVTMQNRGGIDLTNVVAVVDVPKDGDGSGTLADTALGAIVNPDGLTIECSDGGGWSTLCGPGTTQVRAVADTLGPTEQTSFTLYFDVAPSVATGTPIFGVGSLDSDQLAPVPAAAVSPIRVNRCPGTLQAVIFFDQNQNGVRDPGERGLADWILDLTDADALSASYDFDIDGTLDLLLAKGSYDWAVRHADPQPEATFHIVPPVAGDLAICSDATAPLSVPVTCTCDDQVACTRDSCNFLGQCTHEYVLGEVAGVADDTCDGIDQNCNGVADEGFVAHDTTCTNFYGCIGHGRATCQFGTLTDTCLAPYPSQEVCDGIDNDCNGKTDAQDGYNMRIEPCENQKGVCQGAWKTPSMCTTYVDFQGQGHGTWQYCQSDSYILNAWNWYDADFLPGRYMYNDVCDGLDNDCDGGVDEDFQPDVTTCGIGQCASAAATECQAGHELDACQPDLTQAGSEVCDGVDNDCDGLVDQADPDLVAPACESTTGVCAGKTKPLALCHGADGWADCGPADYAYLAHPDFHADNDCDGVDNDCDGLADQAFAQVPVACEGSCSALGTVTCIDGHTVDTCSGGSSAPEICDGIDNDCDGLADASDPNLSRPLCANQKGVCQGSVKPLRLCGPSGWGECAPADYAANAFPAYAANDAVCDGLDNDCDGQTDEDYAGQLALCPLGSCNPTARDRCVGGRVVSGCTPTVPGCAGGGDCSACDPAVEVVVYGIAEDAGGQPTGSFKCTRSQAGVVCDATDGTLDVSDVLWCAP